MTAPIPPAAPAPSPPVVVPLPWRIGAGVGRVAVTVGALLVCFAAYQLWGTGLREASAQDELSARLAAALEARDGSAGSSAPPGLATTGPPATLPAGADADGDAPVVPRAGERRPDPIPSAAVPDAAAPDAAVPSAAVPDDAALVGPIPTPGGTRASAPVPVPLAIGDPVASIRIEAIGLDKTVVQGTTREALRTGPGHYLGTARPGHPGNVGIAGHRTTYGAPFRDIDRLEPGDPIVVETAEGVFTYRVEAQTEADGTTSGHRIVAPEDVGVIADRGDNRLTLTACHPLYSARQRIVVTAVLDGDPVGPETAAIEVALPAADPAPPAPAGTITPSAPSIRVPTPEPRVPVPAATADDDLGWQTDHAAPTLRWALATGGIALAAWALGRIWRRWPAYAVAGPSFALALMTCFAHLDRLLPAA